MGFSIQYIDKDRGVSVRALLLDSLSREDMERECRKLVDEGHRDVQLLESRYTVGVVKRFDEMDDDSNKQLQAENAKLRELIADVHESLKADKAGMFHNLTLSAMEDDMRELGIEVDG